MSSQVEGSRSEMRLRPKQQSGDRRQLVELLKIEYNDSGKKKVALHIPTYLRFKVKEVMSVNTEQETAKMRAVVTLSMVMAGLGQTTIHKITENIKIRVNHQENIDMNPLTNTAVEKSFLRRYGILNLAWEGYINVFVELKHILVAPFNKLILSVDCQVRPVYWRSEQRSIKAKFNLLDASTFDLLWLPKDDINEDEYGFDYRSARIVYTAEFPQKVQGQCPLLCQEPALKLPKFIADQVEIIESKRDCTDRGTLTWSSATYEFEMYRHPIPALVITYIPIMLLSIIGIAVYFQENSLSGRIGSIATLMVAFTAYLPTIRDKIIKTSRITGSDFLVFTVLLINLLTLIRSFLNWQNQTTDYQWKKDPFFWISFVTISLLMIIVIGSIILHYASKKPKYNTRIDKDKNQDKRDKYTATCIQIVSGYLHYGSDSHGRFTASLLNRDQEQEFPEDGGQPIKPTDSNPKPIQPGSTETSLPSSSPTPPQQRPVQRAASLPTRYPAS